MRRSLAHQIRQPEQALRSSGCGRGLGRELVIARAGKELLAQPLQAQACALGYAHYVPLVADRMAERVDTTLRVVGHVLHVREYHAGGAKRA
jgi:hypothetical protein